MTIFSVGEPVAGYGIEFFEGKVVFELATCGVKEVFECVGQGEEGGACVESPGAEPDFGCFSAAVACGFKDFHLYAF